MNLDSYEKIILRKILKEHKERTKEVPECFRDDEVVDRLLKQLDEEVGTC